MTDTEKLNLALQALRNIESPMVMLQKEAEKNNAKLDGLAASSVISDPQFYQTIAAEALRRMGEDKITTLPPSEEEDV